LAFGLEGLAEIVEGEIWRAPRNDLVTHGVTFWSTVGAFARLDAKRALGVLAAWVAEDSEATGRIAEALGDLMRGEALNKIGT
jgi:hypothetical protein